MQWRIINTKAKTAAENMAIDEAIMAAYIRGEVLPTLRLYAWQPAGLSLGYAQKAAETVDFEHCRQLGVDVVRRLTGGRAVLHDDELTYSLVVGTHENVPATITASYRYFSTGIVAGLQKLGIDASMNVPHAEHRSPSEHSSAACFDAPSHYEIIYQGKKLVGSAQVRKHDTILQHGSILLSFSPTKLVDCLKWKTPQRKEVVQKVLQKEAIALDSSGHHFTYAELVDPLLAGFQETLQADFCPGELTEREQAESKVLAATKYNSAAWNLAVSHAAASSR